MMLDERALNRDIVIRDLIRDIVVCPSLSLSMTSQPSPLPPYYRNTQRERGRVGEREREILPPSSTLCMVLLSSIMISH